jgi:hypothetical protein
MEEIMKQVIALFGEAEKGAFKKPYILHQLPQLLDLLGNPPPSSEGLFFAVQAILYDRKLIYFRVAEEGFSQLDYLSGLKLLENRDIIPNLTAICLPGVGDPQILAATETVCHLHKSYLIINQKDFYDYLTSQH